MAECRGSEEMLEDIGAQREKGLKRPAKELVPDAPGSQLSPRLKELLLRNFGAPGGPPSMTDRGRWAKGMTLGCDATVAGRRRRAALRAGGTEAAGSTGGGGYYANKRT